MVKSKRRRSRACLQMVIMEREVIFQKILSRKKEVKVMYHKIKGKMMKIRSQISHSQHLVDWIRQKLSSPISTTMLCQELLEAKVLSCIRINQVIRRGLASQIILFTIRDWFILLHQLLHQKEAVWWVSTQVILTKQVVSDNNIMLPINTAIALQVFLTQTILHLWVSEERCLKIWLSKTKDRVWVKYNDRS